MPAMVASERVRPPGTGPRAEASLAGRWCRLVACTGLLVVVPVGAFFVFTRTGQVLDTYPGTVTLVPEVRMYRVNLALALYTPAAVALLGVVCVAAALLRRRVDLAIAALVALAGMNATTSVLRAVLPRPELGVAASSVVGLAETSPSGHTTAALSFALALALALPRRVLPAVAAAGGAVTAFAAVGMVCVGAHRPSDIVSAVGVALLWAAACVFLVGRVRRRGAGSEQAPAPRPGRTLACGLSALVAGGLAAAVVVRQGVHFAPGTVAHLVGGGTLAGLLLAVTGAVTIITTGVARYVP